ncbi:MAG: helix-turn-helix domain-containing protein [Companilactobacillus sp.]|uniref:helix-turn-helix domain-containing protein n=1 Tax=Companilactobacillus sp. TaxID=2767905 RepID=UPI00260B2808|nr:helix-turn-helix domain-containing protein [Companilactobacillus sp.]MCI1617465.1 helix-turn-helix domain-containing protein [Companilactobacillus sp.]
MLTNSGLVSYLVVHKIRQKAIADALNVSISTVYRKIKGLGFTQQEVFLLNQKLDIPVHTFYDEIIELSEHE